MEETIQEVYATTLCIIPDLIEEKIDIISQMTKIIIMMNQRFSNNRNLPKAIEYIKNCFKYFIEETDLEHQLYEGIVDYVETFSDPTLISDETKENFREILDYFEDLCDTRLISLAEVTVFYDTLIQDGILTDLNYYVSSIQNRIPEEEKAQLLSYIKKED